MAQEEEIPFRIDLDASAALKEQQGGPTIRTNVDAGVNVIDLAAMKAELEANPSARRKW